MPTSGELSHSVLSETDPGSRLQNLSRLGQAIHFTGVSRILGSLLQSHANLRLRTKFLLSLVLIISGLTCATLLVMRHSAQVQMQREIEEAAHNVILTFQVVQQQHQIALSQKADLLATLASM